MEKFMLQSIHFSSQALWFSNFSTTEWCLVYMAEQNLLNFLNPSVIYSLENEVKVWVNQGYDLILLLVLVIIEMQLLIHKVLKVICLNFCVFISLFSFWSHLLQKWLSPGTNTELKQESFLYTVPLMPLYISKLMSHFFPPCTFSPPTHVTLWGKEVQEKRY